MGHLTNLERRMVGNLPQPRNVAELAQALRVDQHAPSLSEEDVHKELGVLADEGWVVNLGEHTDLAKLAAGIEKHKSARTMPDEMSELYATRLANPHHQWRTEGDLWIFTDEGFDKLHEPTVESAPMTPSQVQAVITNEWARTLPGEPKRDSEGRVTESLANKLTQAEFRLWATQVADECERVWGQRPDLPIAGGSQFSDFYENILLDAENQLASITLASPWHMALTTVAVTDVMTGSTITEAAYTGYARKTVSTEMPAAAGTGGSVSNTTAIVFAACTALTSTVIGFAHCVALTAGNVRKFGTCASTVISATQTPAQFAIGAYTTTIQ